MKRDFTNINNKNQYFINELNTAMGSDYQLTYKQDIVNYEHFGDNTVEYSVKFKHQNFTKTIRLYQTITAEPSSLNLDNIRYLINKSSNQQLKDDFKLAYEKISLAKDIQNQFSKTNSGEMAKHSLN